MLKVVKMMGFFLTLGVNLKKRFFDNLIDSVIIEIFCLILPIIEKESINVND